jgi:hypothetical protein
MVVVLNKRSAAVAAVEGVTVRIGIGIQVTVVQLPTLWGVTIIIKAIPVEVVWLW